MKNLIKIIYAILLLSSCQLFSPRPETEAFYCKINGKGWRPEKKTLPTVSANPLSAEWNKKANGFNILASNGKEYIWLLLKVESQGIELKEYTLFPELGKSVGYFNSNNQSQFILENIISKSGKVVITKISNNEISGTFEFNTYDNIKKKTYKITKGQFNDLIYSEF